ncbi:outer membrane beta-barrel protein [Thermodesulfobacteriota bacterium]
MSYPALAKYRVELTPFITFGHEYNDNIYLDHDNRQGDHITTVSPGVKLKIHSRKKGLEAEYSPSWAFYHTHEEENFLRHRARVHLWNNIRKNLRLDIEDTFVNSNDVSDAAADENERSRINLTEYYSNNASAALKYQYGKNNIFTSGYNHRIREYEDDEFDDAVEQGPFFSILHWFDTRNGAELNYSFTSYTYDREDGTPARTDFYGHDAGAGYLHRFSPHTTGNLRYGIFIRDSRDAGADYMVHQVSAGIEKELSNYTTLTLDGGAFTTTGDIEKSTGFTAGAKLERREERGTLTLGAEHGWDEGFLDPDPRGFTTYWTVYGNSRYRLKEDLFSYAGVSYRDNSYSQTDQEDDEVLRGRCGLDWKVSSWLSLDLNYSIVLRRSEDPDEEYVNNRVAVTATISRLFEWMY